MSPLFSLTSFGRIVSILLCMTQESVSSIQPICMVGILPPPCSSCSFGLAYPLQTIRMVHILPPPCSSGSFLWPEDLHLLYSSFAWFVSCLLPAALAALDWHPLYSPFAWSRSSSAWSAAILQPLHPLYSPNTWSAAQAIRASSPLCSHFTSLASSTANIYPIHSLSASNLRIRFWLGWYILLYMCILHVCKIHVIQHGIQDCHSSAVSNTV